MIMLNIAADISQADNRLISNFISPYMALYYVCSQQSSASQAYNSF